MTAMLTGAYVEDRYVSTAAMIAVLLAAATCVYCICFIDSYQLTL